MQGFIPRVYALQFFDPETSRWITCETGPLVTIATRVSLARKLAEQHNTGIAWRGTSKF
jgi:hypothetical protein